MFGSFWPRALAATLWLIACLASSPLQAQALQKALIQVDPGNTKQIGATFGYRLTYNCSSTSGPCLNAEVVDLLPPEVQYVSTVPSSPTGDVASIQVTPNFGGSGRTRVRFVLITPLPAGNSGDLIINVRFPNGTTPNGTVAINTADGINLGTTPGTVTTPPVQVTAVASLQTTLQKTLQSSPANLDVPETYRLRISVSNSNGSLGLTAIGPVVDTLPPGTVFNGATPAADCQPGCVGTTPATLTWSSPCTVPLNPGGVCDINVNVVFPSATFPSGVSVTNSFTANVTPLGQPPQVLGPGSVTHTVTTFVPNPSTTLAKNIEGNSANPPALGQAFSYELVPTNNGNVALDNYEMTDVLPVALGLTSVSTGRYVNAADFAVGEGVQVSYEKNTAPGVFTLWGSSPNTTTNTTLTAPAPGVGAGEYITRVRWRFGQVSPGFAASATGDRPRINGQIINPSNTGAPVPVGSTISNCVTSSAVYTAGPSNVTRGPVCRDFVLSGPFVQLNPAKENLSGAGPFNPGQNVSWRLRVRSAAQSSAPVPLADLVATDLLPVNLNFVSWTFDAQGTGLPAPQVFEQIPNFAGSGRTLLRWRWSAGSGDLGVNQQVWINLSTSIRNGAPSGSLSNTFNLEHDVPGLGQRCSGSSAVDALDLDGDGNSGETLCTATGTVTVAGIAQLISSKTIRGVCDGAAVGNSLGTLLGGGIDYRLRVQNVGTVPMQNFVLIDILPFVGDTGVRDTLPRGSQWTPLLAAPITPPPGTNIYYSTSGNPCRGEVGGPIVGCDAPNWTTVAPVPITSVRAFKIEFGNRVVQPFDFLEFGFLMSTPGTVAPGEVAFNSFAYQADRSDGLGALAAEPQKVGISLGACGASALGDFVWADANANGIQDDGPTGINAVPVFLWQPGADGIPGTLDDVPVASTITGQGPGNAPGWYNFPGLAPGNYFVCIAAPPTFVFSPQDAGGDDTLDSDANPATGCSGVVALGLNEINPTVDFGIVPTERAALGNYVWFDRNSDGLQNESPFDGANGVSVRLWIDDGDNIPEPGTGDTLAATTVTDNDIYGAPGYYLFDGLIPGVRYFVQFVAPAVATGFTGANVGADDSIDSDAAVPSGVAPMVVLAPSEVNLSIDAGLIAPTGILSLGNQVWFDTDNDGLFEPQDGELGIDGVRLDLYRDVNNDLQPSLDEYLATTNSTTASGFAGRYGFNNLAAGNYIVVVAPQNFSGAGALFNRVTSTGNDPAPDPDNDFDGDDNGTAIGALTASLPVTLTVGGEPISEDGDPNTNLTVDFGFIPAAPGLIPEYDYGDAPDVIAGTGVADYNTTVLDNGAYHQILLPGAPYLGACVDGDNGFNQGPGADGDDNSGFGSVVGTCAVPGDDEDGVSFSGPFVPGSPASFSVTAGGATCTLNAWVDWNRNGNFSDPGEQIATNLPVPVGPAVVINVLVPASAQPGRSYARFRCSSAGGIGPTGFAPDGEVEDYAIGIVGRDFGDAPASYGTAGAGAAQHLIDPLDAVYLGACVDFESDGQPSVGADGDDLNAGSERVGLCFDDEDGVEFTSPVAACAMATVAVTASGPARLDAFMDFNNDGDFADAGEQIFTNLALVSGVNPLNFSVPCTAATAQTYARFRISRTGGLGPTGIAPDGEVEDYRITVLGNDFGDAPAPFPTLIADDGARHAVDPASNLRLGQCVDTEANGQPSALANGDDLGSGSGTVGSCAVAGDDEDGVLFAPLIACRTSTISVNANAAGVLDAWADWNGNSSWADAGERIANNLNVVAGANALVVTVPCNASTGPANFRFRLSSTGVASFTGAAVDGEVEDHQAPVQAFDFGDLPNSYGTLLASNGAVHEIVNGLRLGASVDAEADGQPSALADGDDLAGIDDEDGVVLADLNQSSFQPATVRVNYTNPGPGNARICGFIDYANVGNFGAAAVAFADVAPGTGQALLDFGNVPGGAIGQRYARFRVSSGAAACNPVGAAADGEVEDYVVTVVQPTDFGDLPAPYATVLADNGARHPIRPGLRLGAAIDAEANGQPSVNADGDDLNGVPDDEDALNQVELNNLLAGTSNTLSLSASNLTGTAAQLCAFFDWNGDGDFLDVVDGSPETLPALPIPDGSNNAVFTLQVSPPLSAGGPRYARFRLSTDGGACTALGSASDGEVEDYRVFVRRLDYGDLPDPAAGVGVGNYETLRANDGARHEITDTASTLRLGASVDAEGDGQPSAAADGDDLNGVPDDEDGLNPADLLQFAGQPALLRVSATNTVPGGLAANLCGFVDWNGDGNFDGSNERAQIGVPNGSSNVVLTLDFGLVPAGTVGPVHARLRISQSACNTLGPNGFGGAGEVEDYLLTVRLVDLGDLPDTGPGTGPGNYRTLVASNGAAHGIVSGLRMGALVDAEADGQPGVGADGDDLNGVPDDEDGVRVEDLALNSTLPAQVRVRASNSSGAAARICGFIDWNADGDFDDIVGGSAESAAPITVPDGSNDVEFVVDFGITPVTPTGSSYARFRLQPETVACSAEGLVSAGEVEDYPVQITRRDFGDLPDTGPGVGPGNYRTLLADNGAAHDIVDGLFMGALVDPEADGQPSIGADGDDLAGNPNDEDGANLADLANFHLGSPANLRVTATNTTSAPAVLCGFIDWNGDGDFDDSNERASIAVANGSVAASFTLGFGPVPVTAPLGTTYARVRLQAASNPCAPDGLVTSGEVEDYVATVLPGEMSVGNLVWRDRENTGTFSAGDTPFPGIAVDLFRDSNDDGIADGPAIANQSTDANGLYLFDQLVPDTYIVCITAPVDWISSSGTGRRYAVPGPTEPAADPDNDVDNDDNGSISTSATRICAAPVTLSFGQEPVNDGDTDANSNLTVDFGLVYNFDLALRKTLSAGQSYEVNFGDQVSYTIEVFNQGTVPAQTIQITDWLAPGTTLDDPSWTQGPGSIVTRTIAGPLAPGTSTTLTLLARIQNGAVPGILRNVAEISAAADSSGQPVPTILDKDSDPDSDPNNDIEVDDEINNGGGDEDDSDPAFVNLGFGLLGLAKENLGVSINTGGYAGSALAGTANVSLRFVLRNYGTRAVDQLSLVDDVRALLPPGAQLSVQGLSASGGLVVNSAYNAGSVSEMLAPGNSLAAGASANVNLQLLVGGIFNYGIIDNLATVSGVAPGGIALNDVSTDGNNPDPDGNGDPGDNAVPTPIDLRGLANAMPIPTLQTPALALLLLLMLALGLRRMRGI